jgi:hypothetical protein
VTISVPALDENTSLVLPMERKLSTEFTGSIPAFPMGSLVTFTVTAWDFGQQMEVSTPFSFQLATLDDVIPQIPSNGTFLYVYVYDSGAHSWVSGAAVTFAGLSNYLDIATSTRFGVAYPNVSAGPLVPVVLPANASYRVTVTDPSWVGPSTAPINRTVSVVLTLGHTLSVRGPIAVGADYTVVLEGNAMLFFLNATPAAAPSSPGVPSDQLEVPAVIGIVAALVAVVPLLAWWKSVEKRRLAQSRRVTL